jgi:general secretion pathway protein L
LLVFLPARRDWIGNRGTLSGAQQVRYLQIWSDQSVGLGSAALSELPAARTRTAVLDDRDVFSQRLRLPRLSDAKLRLAMPGLLEEQLLADPADCHFAWKHLETTGPDGELASICAINQTTMARVVEAFEQLNKPLDQVIGRQFTLAEPDHGIHTLAGDATHSLIRLGNDGVCSFPSDAVDAMVPMLQSQHGLLQLRNLSWPDAATVLPTDLPCQALQTPIDTAALAGAVNLLQGRFAPRQSFGQLARWIRQIRAQGAWRAPAAWSLTAMAILIGGLNLYWLKMNRQDEALRTLTRQTFRDAFPGEPAIDELAQARQAVGALRARAGHASVDDFTPMASRVALLLSPLPIASVSAIEYADRKLRVRFTSPQILSPATQNTLITRAPAVGLHLVFDSDRSVSVETISTESGVATLPKR